MLEKLLEHLLNSLDKGNWLVVIVIIAIAVIVNIKAILEFFERRGKRRDEFVKESLKLEEVKDSTRFFLEEELNYLVFKRITGISANKILREKIKILIDKSNGELQTFQLAHASNHLKMKDGKLTINITIADNIEYIFNWSFAIFILLFSLFCLLLPIIVKGIAIQQIVIFIGLSVLMFFFGLFLVSQTLPIFVAKKIHPIIEKIESISVQNEG